MQRHDTTRFPEPRTSLGPRSFRRRTILTGLAVAWAGAWARRFPFPAATALAEESQARVLSVSPPLGTTYVGRTSDPETLIGIVLLDNAPGEAVAYLCRGAELNVWFVGRLAGDRIRLLQTIPADVLDPPSPIPTLSGRLDANGITGRVALPDRTLTCSAVPAAGVAGLYVTERDEDGMVRGASSTGAILTARQRLATGAAAAIAPHLIAGMVVAADGSRFELTIPARTDGPAVFRWVALADGTVRGAGRRRTAGRDQFIGSGVDLNRSGDREGFIGQSIEFNQEEGFIESGIDI